MDKNRFRWLALRQLDKKLVGARSLQREAPVPEGGWIKAIRGAIGMPAAQLAARLGVRQSTATRLEKSEADGVITLESLRKAADVMDCDVYYALVPRRSLEQTVLDRAAEVAAEDIARVSQTMALEDQSTDAQTTHDQLNERREALLRASWRNLWK